MFRPDSTELSALAARAFDPQTAPAERDQLIRELSRPLAHLARRVAWGDQFLADELLQHALVQGVRGKFSPNRGGFLAWGRTVLRRHLISLRRSRLLALGGDDAGRERAEHRRDHADLRLDLTSPFGSGDRATVLGWPVRRRVVLLGWFLLWRKLPEDAWACSLADLGIPSTFPGLGFDELPDSDRTDHLADALHVCPNTIVQTLRRGRPLLRGLRFVRELAVV